MRTKLVREGQNAAEVEIDPIDDESAWSPYLSLKDLRRLDRVRLALRRGDTTEAAKDAKIFQLMPLAG